MIVNISFDTGSSTFGEDFGEEATYISRQIKEALFDSWNQTTVIKSIKDINSNKIGFINICQRVPISNL
jgi:hypothetical protein